METAECCQDGSLVMPAGQRWLTEVKGEGKLLCTIVTVEQWTTIVKYMLLTQCKALLNEYE